MLFTPRIFKPVILALLVLLPFGATARADASQQKGFGFSDLLSLFSFDDTDASQKKCFKYSDLPSLPNKAAVECAWGFPDGLAVVQDDTLFVLKDGAKQWVEVDSGPLGIGDSAITTSGAGKL
jgi:hypothetical protein